MPAIDMSDAGFEDPEWVDYFAVVRRKETVSEATGRSVLAEVWFPRVFGNVNQASPNDLERLGDFQYQGGAISIVCKFKLYDEASNLVDGVVQGYQPDLILWAGSYYIVKTLENYSRYGPGFVQAICVEFTYVGSPPQGGALIPSADFSNPNNSAMVAYLFGQNGAQSMLLTVLDANGSPQTIIAPAQGAVEDLSGTLADSDNFVVADANENRAGYLFQNKSGFFITINDDGSADDPNAFSIPPGGMFPPPNRPIPTTAISIKGNPGDAYVFQQW